MIARMFIAVMCGALAGVAGAETVYTERTDQQLTELAADWDVLSEAERRALLTEIKARMHTTASKRPVLTIKTERRYGRVVRRADGSLVRIETTEHTISYQPLPDDAGDRPFGVGFERRAVSGGAPTDGAADPLPPGAALTPSTSAPVISVGTANSP